MNINALKSIAVAGLCALLAVTATAEDQPSITLSLDGVSRLEFAGDLSVRLSQSSANTATVVVKAGELDDVAIDVDGNTFRVESPERSFWRLFGGSSNVRVEVEVSLEQIESLRIYGAAKMEAGDITGDTLSVDVSGASEVRVGHLQIDALAIEASGAARFEARDLVADNLDVGISGASNVTFTGEGSAQSLRLSASGASHYSAEDIKVQSAKVEASGASGVKLHVTETLKGGVSGASTLSYKGSPKMQVNTSGASSLNTL